MTGAIWHLRGPLRWRPGETTALDIGADFGFHFGDAPPELVEGVLTLGRIDIHGDVEGVIEVDEG